MVFRPAGRGTKREIAIASVVTVLKSQGVSWLSSHWEQASYSSEKNFKAFK